MVDLFPHGPIEAADRNEFNRKIDLEYDRIRDFLILHYHVTERDDSDFWNHVRTMEVPDSLHEKIELWQKEARVARYNTGLFHEPSWVSVYIGQGIVPDVWDQRADAPDSISLRQGLDQLRSQIRQAVAAMPDHREFIERRNAAIAEPAR